MNVGQTKVRVLLIAVAFFIPTIVYAQTNNPSSGTMEESVNLSPAIEHINPEGISAAPHFAPAIITSSQKAVYVSGMTGQDKQNSNPLEEYETQLRQAYEKIGITLKAAGASPQDVVRQRVLIVGISQQHAAVTRKVMQEFYGNARPTSTATGTPGLFNPDLVVEVDVTAVLPN